MKTALVIGSEGQDGRLLVKVLLEKEYGVFGIDVADGSYSTEVTYTQVDLTNHREVLQVLSTSFDEIYYLAAYHHSSGNEELSGKSLMLGSFAVNVVPFAMILEELARQEAKTKVFYTSSSLIYGASGSTTQDESTAIRPNCVYSISKKAAMDVADYYRDNYKMQIGIGIMYNHESLYRSDMFLSKIIINQTREFVAGSRKKIIIGDLSAQTDWGYAMDYVEAMWHIIQLPNCENFIISSGKAHKVEDWFTVLFDHVNMDWKQCVEEDNSLVKRKKPVLIGDNSKLLATGWKPKVSFEEMVIKIYNNTI